MVKRHTV